MSGDFAMAGDLAWEYTYQFIDEDDVGFVLLEQGRYGK